MGFNTLLTDSVSHPSWVCGLKPRARRKAGYRAASHPSWVCGLKRLCDVYYVVRPGHTLRGCVD